MSHTITSLVEKSHVLIIQGIYSRLIFVFIKVCTVYLTCVLFPPPGGGASASVFACTMGSVVIRYSITLPDPDQRLAETNRAFIAGEGGGV